MFQRLAFSDLATIRQPLSLALGVFDGVHLGHQAVMARAVERAREAGGLAGVLTFEPHPIQVLAPERAPRRLLASLEHKERLLEDLGLDLLVVVEFTREFASWSAGDFLAELRRAERLHSLAMGRDWCFGKNRGGNVELLEKFGQEHGVAIDAVSAVMVAGERISSTRIRQALRDGNLAAAEEMLGRLYSVMGTVSEGKKLGRELGFPTANLVPQSEQLPPDGVWAVEARWDGAWHPAVANLGRRPTVGGDEDRMLEVHLLSWQGDLYGKELEVRFRQFLRGEKKFDGLEALKEQIGRDVESARKLLVG
ncbi:bifunctional riboflavin kinase/FAD synthetase [Roseibacillus persicicus]|uniref:Riboflavin biosynthesis protein n=1 Tax=Roseibacillus persicicus TaxID=454148 RepID=A0A918TTC9_9BACT|nr:bifunctional riboflavin kinase/FAD synthetase [Roseibacillus persicicus]GHC62506.1 riboflavin biosynthesis protein [Roseibacillus persicicus]